MTFIQWLAQFFKAPIITPGNDAFTGVLPDTRSAEEKAKDYLHEELVPVAGSSDPFSHVKTTQSPYPYENQGSESSCVAHAVGLALAITRTQETGVYTRLSWLFNYRRRTNFAQEGMIIPESYLDYKKTGAPLYQTLPDTGVEAKANQAVITPAMINEAEIYRGYDYYTISGLKDIGTLAALADTGKAVPITIYATYAEWAREYPIVTFPDMAPTDPRAVVHHEVCILPKSGFTENGKKYVTVQDSAPWAGFSLRHVSEDFIGKRVTAAGYWNSANVIGGGPRPHFTFTRTLTTGSSGPDVKALQQLLISENLLPQDCVTGFFAGRTLAGMRAFQMKYESEILTPEGLSAPTNTFGPSTRKKANALCV